MGGSNLVMLNSYSYEFDNNLIYNYLFIEVIIW